MSTLGFLPGLGRGGRTHSLRVTIDVTVAPGEDDSGEEAPPWGSGANAALGAIDGPRADIFGG